MRPRVDAVDAGPRRGRLPAAAISRGLSACRVARRAPRSRSSVVGGLAELRAVSGCGVVAAREVLADRVRLVRRPARRVTNSGARSRTSSQVEARRSSWRALPASVSSASSRRSATRASRTRLFTVPSGTPSRSAISACESGRTSRRARAPRAGRPAASPAAACDRASRSSRRGHLAPDVGQRQRRRRRAALLLGRELRRRAGGGARRRSPGGGRSRAARSSRCRGRRRTGRRRATHPRNASWTTSSARTSSAVMRRAIP